MTTQSSSRINKVSSPRRRGGSRQNSSQKKTEPLSLSDDPDYSISRGTSSLEEIPSPLESDILEEYSRQPNNNIALVDSYPPVANEKADPAVSTGELVTTLRAVTGSASSILSSSLEADTQPECLDQTCPLMAYIHLVSIVKPTDSTLSLNISRHTLKISQQTSLNTPIR